MTYTGRTFLRKLRILLKQLILKDEILLYEQVLQATSESAGQWVRRSTIFSLWVHFIHLCQGL